MSTSSRACQNCKKEFLMEPEDFVFYERVRVPAPTFCPECRLVRRLVWRNERTFYKRECDLCHAGVISMYAADALFPVYCPSCWYSDKWDPSSYGIVHDFSKGFFEQFRELEKSVPHPSSFSVNSVNSPYANFVDGAKSVYLSYSTVGGSEEVYYSKNIDSCSFVFDSLDVSNSEYCSEIVAGEKNYNCRYVMFSRNCIDCSFLVDCTNCRNCTLCVNLRNREFCINNEQYSKDEYLLKLSELDTGSYQNFTRIKGALQTLRSSSIFKYARLTNCANVVGDQVSNSRNAYYAFTGYDFENVKYIFRSLFLKDSMDAVNAGHGELFYEFMSGGGVNGRFLRFVVNGRAGMNEVEYSDFCGASSHLFGCVALKGKEYSILNTPYTKSEYEALVPRIKDRMNETPYSDPKGRVYRYGEFFPFEFSPFAYNETIAQEHFPLTRDEALLRGYTWREPEVKDYAVTQRSADFPDHIRDASDSILQEVLECAHGARCAHQCTTAFRIISQELEHYRKVNLPLPRLCPNCRHYERLAQKNPLRLWRRRCMCCGRTDNRRLTTSDGYRNTAEHFHGEGTCSNEFETSYAPERPERIYCEYCYQAEVS